jgi:AraC-like DNA-binding protein
MSEQAQQQRNVPPRRWRDGRLAEVARLGEIHKRLAGVLVTELPIPTQEQLAQRFGYSRTHISRIICSRVFQDYLQAQRDEMLREALRLRFDDDRARQVARELEQGAREANRQAAPEPHRTAGNLKKTAGNAIIRGQ